jgi:hypothetical protein
MDRRTAVSLLSLTSDYLDVLDRYGGWSCARRGRIVYNDAVQVVTVPYRYPHDWPFGRPGTNETV